MTTQRPDPQRAKVLNTLREQAADAGRQLALDLRRLQLEHQREQDKLRNLQQFAAQYREQLQSLEAAGGSWSQVRGLRDFIARLNAAQTAQQGDIERVAQQLAAQARAWAQARQKEKAFELLLEQQHGLAAELARKQVQAELQDWNLSRPMLQHDEF